MIRPLTRSEFINIATNGIRINLYESFVEDYIANLMKFIETYRNSMKLIEIYRNLAKFSEIYRNVNKFNEI